MVWIANDFGKLRRAQGHPPGWLMSKLLDGERPVRVTVRIRSANGQATVDVERVEISGLQIDPAVVKTNIVIFDCESTGLNAVQLCEALQPHGIWALDTAPYSVRFVTHCDVDRPGCERAIQVLRDVVAKSRPARA